MEGCYCCKIVQGGGEGYQKIVAELEGGWVLSHCGIGDRTYLGRLVLQVKRHCSDWSELHFDEEKALGLNIRRTIKSLKQYWDKYSPIPRDFVERVYVAYFDETPFINRLSGERLSSESHIHIHLLTRTREIGRALDYCKDKLAWYLLDNIKKFPPEYKILSLHGERVKNLMQYLQVSLYRQSVTGYQS